MSKLGFYIPFLFDSPHSIRLPIKTSTGMRRDKAVRKIQQGYELSKITCNQ
jgi:hypothetical protein